MPSASELAQRQKKLHRNFSFHVVVHDALGGNLAPSEQAQDLIFSSWNSPRVPCPRPSPRRQNMCGKLFAAHATPFTFLWDTLHPQSSVSSHSTGRARPQRCALSVAARTLKTTERGLQSNHTTAFQNLLWKTVVCFHPPPGGCANVRWMWWATFWGWVCLGRVCNYQTGQKCTLKVLLLLLWCTAPVCCFFFGALNLCVVSDTSNPAVSGREWVRIVSQHRDCNTRICFRLRPRVVWCYLGRRHRQHAPLQEGCQGGGLKILEDSRASKIKSWTV